MNARLYKRNAFKPERSQTTLLKPDATDTKILRALMEDGSASFRELARKTSLTTPTVSARIARMKKSGLIRKIVPILSSDSVDRGVLALVTAKVPASRAERMARELSNHPEVEAVYMTTGQAITLKVALDDASALQTFLGKISSRRHGVEVVSSQIVTRVVKDEPPSLLPAGLTMNLKCDYCGGLVTSSRPYNITSGYSHYYFCCKTCRREYLDKHGKRLPRPSPH